MTDKNLFAYCDNNPISRKDDGGQFWNIVIGAAVGGLISGATAAMDSISKTGSVDWTAVVISNAVGAVSGGVAATGLRVMAQATITAAASGFGSVLTDVHSRNQDSNAGKITLGEIGTIAARAIANAARGISSVVGTLFTWPTATAIAINL